MLREYQFCIYVISVLHGISSHTMEASRSLLDDKLANYTKVFRPLRNQSEQISVSVKFSLLSIREFDEVRGKLSIVSYLQMHWTDEYMTWDPDNYDGIMSLRVEGDMAWTPSVAVTDTIDEIEKIGFESTWQPIIFRHTGLAQYFPGGVFTSACDVDISNFPWDKHKCRIQFTVWGYLPSEIQLLPDSDSMDMSFYTPNSVWEYKGSEIIQAYGNLSLNTFIFLDREPLFIFVNVILPVIFMTVLNCIIFLIPIESGERISYSITVLLAIAVFYTLIGDNLPKISRPMSVLSYYLLVTLAISVCMTLANIYSLILYYRDDEEEVGRLWYSFTTCLSRKCNRKLRKMSINPNDANKTGSTPTLEEKQTDQTEHLNLPAQLVKQTWVGKQKIWAKWQDVSKAVDKFCFTIFMLMIIISTIVYFGIVLSK